MNKAVQLGLLAAALAATAGPVSAQAPPERLELTMKLLPENAADAADIVHQIQLPPAAESPPAAGQPSGEPPGAEHGQGQGLETAAEARERGREFGQSVAEQARENRENKGRGEDPPGRPENPGPPDNVPGPPSDPGKP
jgi:hypothetical protein